MQDSGSCVLDYRQGASYRGTTATAFASAAGTHLVYTRTILLGSHRADLRTGNRRRRFLVSRYLIVILASMRTRLFIVAALLAVFAATAHALAIHFALYWSLPWFDFPVHIAAAGMVGVLSYIVASWGISRQWTPHVAFVLLLCIGVSWEIFEYLVGTTAFLEAGFTSDTLQDLCADVLGGGLAIWWAHRTVDPTHTV